MYNKRWDDVLNTLGMMYAQGIPCPGVVSLGPAEIPVSEYRRVSPSTWIFQRVYDGQEGSLDRTPQQWRDQHITAFPSRQGADWYITNNEVNRWDSQALQWWLDQMQWCIANNFPMTVLNYGVGNPPGDQLAVWGSPLMAKILRLIRDTYRKDGRPLFVLNLHAYDLGDWLTCDWTGKDDIQRWKKTILPWLPVDLQERPPWLIHGEYGQQWGKRLTEDQLLTKMRNAHNLVKDDPYLLCWLQWQIGDEGSGGSEDYTGDNQAALINAFPRLYRNALQNLVARILGR